MDRSCWPEITQSVGSTTLTSSRSSFPPLEFADLMVASRWGGRLVSFSPSTATEVVGRIIRATISLFLSCSLYRSTIWRMLAGGACSVPLDEGSRMETPPRLIVAAAPPLTCSTYRPVGVLAGILMLTDLVTAGCL